MNFCIKQKSGDLIILSLWLKMLEMSIKSRRSVCFWDLLFLLVLLEDQSVTLFGANAKLARSLVRSFLA